MNARAVAPAASGNRHTRRAAAKGEPSRFAAAFGLEAPKDAGKEEASAEAPEKPTKKDDESDDDYAKRVEKWEEECKKAKAGTEEEETEAETEEEKKEAAAFASGFQAGGDRWAAVLSNKAAAGKGLIACHLLATTTMTADDVVASLAAMPADKAPAAAGGGLAVRMAAQPIAAPSTGAAAPTAGKDGMVTADAVMAAAALARGEKPATA